MKLKDVVKKIKSMSDGKSAHEEFAVEIKDGNVVTTLECYIRRKWEQGQLIYDRLYITDNVSMSPAGDVVNKLYIDEEIEDEYEQE